MQFRNDDKVPPMKSCQSHFNDLIEEFKVKVENDQAATGAGTAWTELDAVLKTCLDQINEVKEEKKCKAEQTAADKATRAAEDSFVISSCLKRLKEKPSYMKVVDSSDTGLSDVSADSESSSSDCVALCLAPAQFSSCIGRAESVTAVIAGCNESSDVSDSSASTSSATSTDTNTTKKMRKIITPMSNRKKARLQEQSSAVSSVNSSIESLAEVLKLYIQSKMKPAE